MSTPDYGQPVHRPEAPQPPVAPEQAPLAPVAPEQRTIQAVGTSTHPEVTFPAGSPVDVIGRAHQDQMDQIHQAQARALPETAQALPTEVHQADPADQLASLGDDHPEELEALFANNMDNNRPEYP